MDLPMGILYIDHPVFVTIYYVDCDSFKAYTEKLLNTISKTVDDGDAKTQSKVRLVIWSCWFLQFTLTQKIIQNVILPERCSIMVLFIC